MIEILANMNYFVSGDRFEMLVLSLVRDVTTEEIERMADNSIYKDLYLIEYVVIPVFSHRTVVKLTHI